MTALHASASARVTAAARRNELRASILLTVGTLAAAGLVMWASLPG